ncbi:hypothetical protein LINPERPRIM_LOCUS11175 [Linum perenne]
MNRFIPKSTERQAPFFTTLKAATKFSWTKECSRAFEELKSFLTTPPVIEAPLPGDELYLYVAIAATTVSSVLVKRAEKRRAMSSIQENLWWLRKQGTPRWISQPTLLS